MKDHTIFNTFQIILFLTLPRILLPFNALS
jgi:hypothetical protein